MASPASLTPSPLPARWCAVGWLAGVLLLAGSPALHAQALLSVTDAQAIEGNSGTTQLDFTLPLSDPATGNESVNYYTAGFSANPGADFIATNGLVTFAPGATSATVTIQVLGDLLNEPDEVVWLYLTNGVNLLVLDDRGDGVILNDDPQPSLAISGAAVVEGDSGSTNAVFNVALSAPSGRSITGQYTTQPGTAGNGTDFLSKSDFFVLAPGTTNTTIEVTVFGDLLDENDEQFTVAITNAVNSTLPTGPATGTILDNDPLPALSIGDVTLIEGTGGSSAAAFPVTLAVPSGRPLTVDFQTLNGIGTGGSDFIATNGTLTFLPGVTNLTVAVAVVADASIEGMENFSLRLNNPVNISLVRTQALATILDDETRTLTFTNAASITADLSGIATPYPTQIELSGLIGTVVKVTATLVGVTHSFPDDFDILLVGPQGQTTMLMSDSGGGNAINNVTLTFDDAAATELPDLATISSGTYRPSDYVATDVLVGPAPGGPYGSGLDAFNGLNPNGTWSLFVFDDAAGGAGSVGGGWRLSLTLSNLVCCAGGNSDLSVTVSDSPDPVTTTSNLTYTARIINNGPAGATGVFVTNTLPAGVSLISASSTHGSLTTNSTQIVGSLGTLGLGVQATITFVVRPTTFGVKTNVMTVQSEKVDPDLVNNIARTPTLVSQLAPLLTIADASMNEGDWGNSNLLFTVSLSRSHTLPVTASFATAAGTATANTDYLTTSDVFTFAPGVTNVLVAIPVIGDISVEPNETFSVLITGLTNALLADGSAVGTIVNDDGLAQRVQSFTWSALGATQYVGAAIAVTITARDVANNVATTFTGPAKLTAITGSGPDVSMVISEIDTDANDSVEFANVAGSPLDVSGWQVTFYDWFRWPSPAASFVVPVGTVCGANEVFTVYDNASAPGTYPNFSLGENLFWNNEDATNMVAVLLRDADGRVVDFVCAVDAFPGEISSPIFIPAAQWNSAPISANTNTSLTYRRTGNSDTHSATNFGTGAPDPGSPNAEMIVPFTGTRPLPTTPGFASNFVNGIWSGLVTVGQAANSAALRASDIPGHTGVSGSFTILPAVDLALGLTRSVAALATGQQVTFTLRTTNVGVTTASSVRLTNALPPGFNFAGASTTQGTFNNVSGLIIFDLGTLASGAVATATVNAIPTVGGNFTNTATIGAVLPDSTSSNNVARVSVFVNSPPVLAPIGTRIIAEGGTLVVTNNAGDPDLPANQLTFQLLAAPAGAILNGNIFTWSPSESDGPGTNTVTVRVQDNSTPNLSATQSWTVIVSEINSPPTLAEPVTQYLPEGGHVTFTNLALDADLPANQLTYTLLDPPAGATISVGGIFAWTPGEAQGPAVHNIRIKVQDNGLPSLSATQTAKIVVFEINSPPTLLAVSNRVTTETTPVVITNAASDPDLPANALTYSLLTGPSGASLTPAGVFSWTPAIGQSGSNFVALKVADNGIPSLSATQTFVITVTPLNSQVLSIAGISRVPPGVALQFSGPPGYTYVVESRPLGSGAWLRQGEVIAPSGNLPVVTRDPAGGQSKFYRVRNLTLLYQPPQISARFVSNGWFYLTFAGQPGRSYAVESRTNLTLGAWAAVTNVALTTTSVPLSYVGPGSPTANEFRITRYALPVPLQRIDRIERSGTNVNLYFTLAPGLPAAVEYASNPALTTWLTLTNLPAFSNQVPVKVTDAFAIGPRFYRLRFTVPSAPVTISSQTSSPPAMQLWFNARSNETYMVQYRDSVSGGLWQTLTNLPAYSTNSARLIIDPVGTQPQRYYRLRTP